MEQLSEEQKMDADEYQRANKEQIDLEHMQEDDYLTVEPESKCF